MKPPFPFCAWPLPRRSLLGDRGPLAGKGSSATLGEMLAAKLSRDVEPTCRVSAIEAAAADPALLKGAGR